MKPSNNLENKTPSDTYWRDQLVCKEISGSQFFRTTTGIQSGQDIFERSRFIITFLTIFGVTEISCSFRLVIEGKPGKEIPESSRLEFLEKLSANNFALSDAEGNTSGSLNRGGIADLPLLRTLLAICQKSQEPSFWELRTLLEWLLPYLNFTLDPFGTNEKNDLYELWQQRK